MYLISTLNINILHHIDNTSV